LSQESFFGECISGLQYQVLKSKGLGKKEAISLGVSIALWRNYLLPQMQIVDSRIGHESITKPFQSESVQLVAGPVYIFIFNFLFFQFFSNRMGEAFF